MWRTVDARLNSAERRLEQAQDLATDEPGLIVAGRDDELPAVLPASESVQGQRGDVHAQALGLAPAPPAGGHRDL